MREQAIPQGSAGSGGSDREGFWPGWQGRIAAVAVAAGAVLALLSGPAMADFRNAAWGESSPLELAGGGQVPGGCPIESPAGLFLFTAQRPSGDLDNLVNQRASKHEPFQPANPLPAPVNDENADDFCPTPLPDGEFFFVSRRTEGSCGGADMFRTVLNPATGWEEPVNLGCTPNGPNTPTTEFSPAVITNVWGTFLFFSTDFYTGNQDIYVSKMRPDGSFGKGERLPYPINTDYDDRQPNVSQDGRELVFASNRRDPTNFDIFYAKRFWQYGRWRKVTNLSETVPFDTLDASETRPSLSWDGERLVYGSGGVWLSERDYRKRR